MKLSDREWGEFKIADILSNSINAKAYHSNSLVKTKLKGIAYITRTNLFNGLQGIVESNQNFKENPLNTIVFGAENATYFYQPFKYITGNKMYYYNTSKLSQEVNLFITCCLNLSLKGCGFGFGMGLTGTRSDSRKFLLPINDNGEPDYEFMEEYIKEIINKKRQKYIEYVKDKMKSLKVVGGESLENKNWIEFRVGKLFDIEKCKCSNVSILKSGDVPYIGATNKNNGVMNFIKYDNKLMTKGNCIVFICDGQGSVGYSIYKKENFIGSTTLKVGRNDYLNEYNALFITTALDKNKSIYSFGYKRNEPRLKREAILLPATQQNQPDYEFMENYIKNLMYNKYNNYLKYIKQS